MYIVAHIQEHKRYTLQKLRQDSAMILRLVAKEYICDYWCFRNFYSFTVFIQACPLKRFITPIWIRKETNRFTTFTD